MIHLLRHSDIDQQRWDACLARAQDPLVYAHAWYLNTVCGPTWEALVEQRNGAYVSILPVPVKKFLGQKSVYQPLFTQQLGLFCTPESQHRSVEEYLSILISSYGQVQYQLPLPTAAFAAPTPWQSRTRPNYELSLLPPYPDLYRQYATNLKRNLKKAQAAPLQATPAESFDTLLRLFKQTKGQELTELQDRHYTILTRLYQSAKAHGAGQLWEVRLQDQVLCSAFFLYQQTSITYLFGASSETGRQLSAMAFLMDFLIQHEAGSGKTFDFEGSEIAGVAKFYANFGAQAVSYLSLSFQNPSSTRQWIRNAFTSLAKRLR